MDKKKRTLAMFLIGCILALGMTGCGRKDERFTIRSEVDQLHNGDAKFYKDYVITNVGGIFTIYDLDRKKLQEYPDISVNWLDGITEDDIIIYGNFDKQIGILQLNDKLQVVSNNIIIETENLQIDPTIIKVDGKYYITVTEIQGTVNNADPNAENGIYTLKLYKSEDLTKWEFVSDVLKFQNNIEDVDVRYDNEKFYVFFEKETVDRGDSSINVAVSSDASGKEFNEIHELLPATCDHEPSIVEKIKDGYRLYYSCDKNYHGESYNGGQVFYAEYDSQWNAKKTDEKVDTETEKGILLYDVTQNGTKKMLVYTRNYLTDNDMVIEEQ